MAYSEEYWAHSEEYWSILWEDEHGKYFEYAIFPLREEAEQRLREHIHPEGHRLSASAWR